MIPKKAPHHGDTADTAKGKNKGKGIYHRGHGEHGEKPGQNLSLLLLLSVSSVLSVVNAFDFRRARRVAVVQMRLWP
jgi:hypothetical protein